jgi:hypothetical protein
LYEVSLYLQAKLASMRKLLTITLLFIGCIATAQSLDYYLPKNVTYNASIPTPKSVIYHEVGEWHVTHDRLVNYMKAIATAAPDRVKLETMGFTYEQRPQVLLIITSPKNQQRLEEIRQQHLLLSDPTRSASVNIDNMPIVVWIGHSIHGNEQSGTNASLLSAYYLAAAQGKQIDDLLDNVVILFDPSFNPDGMQRFSTWANQHKSKNLVTDPNSREFNEVWPGGRFNHYWFDLNRDWLPSVHVESQNRLQWFHKWKPNILTDHHEQGSNSTFFFQPGVTARVNPLTPEKNQELTNKLAKYHAKALDKIGSLYFTKESYDDFYYGKGSTYPDINGAIGILFEQASSRGHAQETANGLLTFPFTIRNQFTTTLSTLEAAKNLRKDLLTYQRDFYKNVKAEAANFPTKAYVIGDDKDKGKTKVFVEMLLKHQVKIYQLKQDEKLDGKTFKAESAYVIPTDQPQFKLVKTMFEKTLEYKDSLFYDVTSWTMPLAFGLPYAEVKTAVTNLTGEQVTAFDQLMGQITGGFSNYGYLLRWNELFAPKVLYQLQSKGLKAKVATQKLSMQLSGKQQTFDYGTIFISARQDNKTTQQVFNSIEDAVRGSGLEIYSVNTGLSTNGINLGSNSFFEVKMPKIMMFGGTETSQTDVGEIWHLLDQRFNIPVSIVDIERFNSIEPSKYNVIIMPSGTYKNFDKPSQDKLKSWVSDGGTLIATDDAAKWLSTNGFTKVIFKTESSKDTTRTLPYYLRTDEVRAKEMAGSIFEAKIDLSHPIAYGYSEPTVSIFKSNTLFMDKNNGYYDAPVIYTDDPLQSGYLYRGYKNLVRNSAVINIDQVGKGRIISMVDNLNFRAFWLGTNKLFMNSIFFGDIIRLQ